VGWADVVGQLYARRAEAFTAGRAADLSGVYAPRSPLLAVDTARLAELGSAGQHLEGFAPQVVEVVEVTEVVEADEVTGGVRLVLVDRVPGYTVSAADGAQQVPARAERTVVMTLLVTASGWRIDTAAFAP
jgi:hypothetical protein